MPPRSRKRWLALLLRPGRPAFCRFDQGPSFQARGPHDDFRAYFIRPKDTDWGIATTWRQSGGLNPGVRGENVQILSGAGAAFRPGRR